MEKKNIDGVSFLTFPFLSKYHLFCGFTCRDSGCSSVPYDSLNLAYHVGDRQEDVRKNRELILEKLLCNNQGPLYSARQVHGDKVIYIGKGKKHIYGDIQEDADGLMTDRKDVPVMVMGADCSLSIIADIGNRAICAVHSGWRGVLDRILLKAINAFCSRFGSNKDKVYVFIGPGIRQCCYQVDSSMAGRFRKTFGPGDFLAARDGGQYLDLAGLNMKQIRAFGIPKNNIFDTGICTGCDSHYYSYRREGTTGRQAAIGMIF